MLENAVSDANAFCAEHAEDWQEVLRQYHVLVPKRPPRVSVADHHVTISLESLLGAFARRVFLVRWFCATDFPLDKDHFDAMCTLHDVIAGREAGALRAQVILRGCSIHVRDPGGALRASTFALPDPTPIRSRSTRTHQNARVGPPGGVRIDSYFLQNRRKMSDFDGAPKAPRMDGAPSTNPIQMTEDECKRFLAAAPPSAAPPLVPAARTAARRWMAMYEFHHIGAVFGEGRVIFGTPIAARAVSDDAFEVTFDADEPSDEYVFGDRGWERAQPRATAAFAAPPRQGSPEVYMGADAERLRAHIEGGGVRALPPVTDDTEYNYRW